ncbi:MAG: hypothetical protein ACLGIK_00005 [Gemmatimonadota bacterium]
MVSGAAPASTQRAATNAESRRLLVIVGQLGVLLALIFALRIENAAFYARVAPLAFGGAIINHLLPARHRLAFFALLSVSGVWVVFGWEQGSWILGIGLGFLAICHLRVPYWLRVALLLTAGGAMALLRAGTLTAPWSPAIWAAVGSMLMFRLILYMYDLPHLKTPTSWDQRIAYFFCLPNVVFPLFPAIDFSTFRRTYYDRPPAAIYREGVEWILRGIAHLVTYRLVYQYGTLSPADVHSGADLAMYMVANFGLYLRVSGQFHLIVGMLHLFGFRLPETHRFFYLSSSFSDLWRRINIYWKDFMQKVFYMPLFLRLVRRRGETFAIVTSTLVVFAVTWFFHSYQWFWLLGTWLWSTTDALFWAVLGCCLVANSLYEARAGRARSVSGPTIGASGLWVHGLKTAAMFSVMCILWTLWTTPTLGAFAALMRSATFGPSDVVTVLGVWSAVAAAAALTYRRAHATAGRSALPGWAPMSGAMALAAIPALDLASIRPYVPSELRAMVAKARDVQLNKRDQEQLQRGYYEKIVGVNRSNDELWRVYSLRPADWVRLDSTGAVRLTEDDRLEELVPGWSSMFHGGRLTVNSAGLRDREYTRDKPAGVFRIVVLGQSYVLGEGVNDEETFENVLEDRLNESVAASLGYARIEILNLGAPAYSAMQQRADVAVGRAGQWNPDLVLCIGHFRELAQLDDYFSSYLRQRPRDRIPPYVSQWIDSAGLTRQMTAAEAERRMAPFATRILAETYRDMVRRIVGLGATPVFAYIPTPAVSVRPELLERYLDTTMDAGFVTRLDLRRVYEGLDEHDLILAEWDHHPNAAGHRRIAARLFDALMAQPALLRPGSGERRGTVAAP